MIRIPGVPKAETDLHGRLRVLVVSADAIACFEHTDNGAVDEPGELGGCPVEGIGAEGSHWRGDGGRGGVVVSPRDALAEEVGLHDVVVGATKFPVDLVEGVREEDEGANDTIARGGLGDDFNATEKEVEVSRHLRRVALLEKLEFGAVLAAVGVVCDVFVIGECPFGGLFSNSGEIHGICSWKAGLRWADSCKPSSLASKQGIRRRIGKYQL